MDDRSLADELAHNEMPLAQALSELCREPSPALYRRLAAIPEHRSRRPARLAWAAGAALVVVALLFTLPAARATIDQIVERVGQVYFTVADKLPYREEATIVEGVPMSLDEARAAVPFAFGVPAHLPAGYELDRVEVWTPNETVGQVVVLAWRDPDGMLLQLQIYAFDEGAPIHTLVGLDSIETVLVSGSEAALVRGAWDSDSGAWGHQEDTVTLIWQVGAVQYSLDARPELITVDELVSIAESVE
jgi:hypothetical protein